MIIRQLEHKRNSRKFCQRWKYKPWLKFGLLAAAMKAVCIKLGVMRC